MFALEAGVSCILTEMHAFISTLSFCLVLSGCTIYMANSFPSNIRKYCNIFRSAKIRSRDLTDSIAMRRDADQRDEELHGKLILILSNLDSKPRATAMPVNWCHYRNREYEG
jgi:hypothetical protein